MSFYIEKFGRFASVSHVSTSYEGHFSSPIEHPRHDVYLSYRGRHILGRGVPTGYALTACWGTLINQRPIKLAWGLDIRAARGGETLIRFSLGSGCGRV